MAELPDLEVFSRNLNKMFAKKKLSKIKVVYGNKLKDKPSELSKNLEGKILESVYRSGKEMRFKFSGGSLLGLHLMLTGDIMPFEKKNENKLTIVEMHFDGAGGIALTDRMKNANVKLNPVDKDGVDALSKELNFKYLKNALKRKTTIKNILMDQNVIRGIGNSYSDEILWQTRISPFSVAETIPDEKIRELARVIKMVLKKATQKIYKAFAGRINVEVKSFLEIHNKEKKQSPTGAEIKIDAKGMRKTYYTDEQVLYK